MSETNQGRPNPVISRAAFMLEARKRLTMWGVALIAAVAPNGWGLVSHLRQGTVDQGVMSGTPASVYLITALAYFEARFVVRLVIREYLLAWFFHAFSRVGWVVSAACCGLSWRLTDIQKPVTWEWPTVVALAMLVLERNPITPARIRKR